MIQIVAGVAVGYVLGTKAGRRRYHQLKKGYETVVNSPATRSALRAGRKAIANRLDPEPRMREVHNLRTGEDILETDSLDYEQDILSSSPTKDAKGRPVKDQ